MPEINKANRQVCDLDIRRLKDMAPYLFFDTANTTTANISADSVFAMAKGTKRIGFPNPIDGTLAIEAQVYPFRLFAMLAGGEIQSDALYTDRIKVKCATDGELTITLPKTATVATDSVFVFPEGEYGNESKMLESVTYTAATETAPSKIEATTGITAGKVYEIGVTINRTGVKRVAFNNKQQPTDYFITASTLDKDENGVFTPFKQIYYKATPQRNFELAFSSDGDPVTVSMTFDLFEDKDGNVMDMIEIDEDAA